MKVIKRDGRQVEYDRNKIAIAIEKANEGVEKEERISEDKIYNIIASIESRGADMMQVEDIQDIIADLDQAIERRMVPSVISAATNCSADNWE